MYSLPTEIQIKDQVLRIRNRGDFRVIIDCFAALQDEELELLYRVYTAAFIFYENFNSIEDVMNYPEIEEAVSKMYWFFNCGESWWKDAPEKNYKLIDWKADSQLVSSAINAVIGDEIRLKDYVHWWTFMGYYNAIGECTLSTVVSIRKKIMEHKNLEKYEIEYKRDNPQFFSVDLRSTSQKENDRAVFEIWNNT